MHKEPSKLILNAWHAALHGSSAPRGNGEASQIVWAVCMQMWVVEKSTLVVFLNAAPSESGKGSRSYQPSIPSFATVYEVGAVFKEAAGSSGGNGKPDVAKYVVFVKSHGLPSRVGA